jgi:chaperonin GroES
MTTKNTKEKEQSKLIPLGERVLVLPDESGEVVTKSGIVVAGQTTGNFTGTVLAVGPGRETDQGNFIKAKVKPGDRVLLGTYGHEDVVFEGKKYYMVSESSLLAVIN